MSDEVKVTITDPEATIIKTDDSSVNVAAESSLNTISSDDPAIKVTSEEKTTEVAVTEEVIVIKTAEASAPPASNTESCCRYLYLYFRIFMGQIDVQDSIDTTGGIISYNGGPSPLVITVSEGVSFLDIERINHTKDVPLPLVTVTPTGYSIAAPNANNYYYKVIIRLL